MMGYIKNNLKRMIPLIAAGIMFYVFSYTLPGILKGDDFYKYSNFSEVSRIFSVFLAIVASVWVCSISHKKNSVAFHFSLPIKRREIFFGNMIIGLIVIALPHLYLMLNHIVAGYPKDGWEAFITAIICGFMSLAISMFAGVITGNNIIHAICAIWFNMFIPTIYLLYIGYGEVMLHGFSTNLDDNFLAMVSPLWNYNFEICSVETVIYIGIAVVMAVAAYFLFEKLKLERAEQGITFKGIMCFLVVVIGVYGSALLSVILYQISESTSMFLVAAAIGAVSSTVFGYMLINKKTRIFNREFLKVVVPAVVISMVISCAFCLDLFNYEDRIPDAEDVKSVQLYCSANEMGMLDQDIKYTSKEIIGQCIALHSGLVADKGAKDYVEGDVEWEEFTIEYETDKGNIIRQYYMPNRYENIVKSIYESDDIKNKNLPSKRVDKVSLLEIFDYIGTESEKYVDDKDDIKKIFAAMDKDFLERTYEESDYDNVVNGVGIETNNKSSEEYVEEFLVYKSDSETLKALKEILEN